MIKLDSMMCIMLYLKNMLNYYFGATKPIENTADRNKSTQTEVVNNDSLNDDIQIEEENNNNNKSEWSLIRVLNDEMLSDNEIYQASLILKDQFKHLKGFYDPQAFNARFFKNKNKLKINPNEDWFVQIMHDGHHHWYTITNLNAYYQIKIYDSFYMKKTYKNNQVFEHNLQKLLSSNETSQERRLTVCSIESVQTQSSQTMCGLYAIAFAYDLCVGLDPSEQHYDESKMRYHLFKCLTEKSFSPFPKCYTSGIISIVNPSPNKIEVLI